MRTSRFILFFSLIPFLLSAQPGKDGPLTVSAPGTVVNSYTDLAADAVKGAFVISVGNVNSLGTPALSYGDLVLIIQMQGADMDISNTPSYGTITNYGNCGSYEFAWVCSVSGNNIHLMDSIKNSYDVSGHIQVVRVPLYTQITINPGAEITTPLWDGKVGGIVALHSQFDVIVNGKIDADTLGFRAGFYDNAALYDPPTITTDYVSSDSAKGAEKGESIVGDQKKYSSLSGRYSRGAPANGGGGGNAHNSGGGGGANATNGKSWNGAGVMCTSCNGSTAWMLDPDYISNGNTFTTSSGGGKGGYTYATVDADALTLAPSDPKWGGDNRDPVGGRGGHPLTIINSENKIFFGGGGGAGDGNNFCSNKGGNGGGLVYIVCRTISGAGVISSNGQDGYHTVNVNADAPGGGGAGGSIVVKAKSISGSLTFSANGGAGGNQEYIDHESEGPGGGGGGGFIALTSISNSLNTVNGGINGVSASIQVTEFPCDGATSGGDGTSTTVSTKFPPFLFEQITATNKPPQCFGDPIQLNTDTVPAASYSWTGPDAFNSPQQNPTVSPSTSASAGTYTVSIALPSGCKISTTTALVVPPQLIVAPVGPITGCKDESTQLSVNPTGGTPTYKISWSPGGQTGQTINVKLDMPVTYIVSIEEGNGCVTETQIVVDVNPLPDVHISSDVTEGCPTLHVNFKDKSSVSSGTITQWRWDFGDSSSFSSTPQAWFETPGTYKIRLTVASDKGCSATDSGLNVITVYDQPKAAFAIEPDMATIIDPTFQFKDQSIGATQWLWDFGDPTNRSGSSLESPVHTYPEIAKYCVQLKVLNENKCWDTITHCLEVLPEFTFYVPNAFSPNGDLHNETFNGRGIGIKAYNMIIFDRWGNLIFTSNDLFLGWDGRVNNSKVIAQQDVYVYKIYLTDIFDRDHSYIGHVTLLH